MSWLDKILPSMGRSAESSNKAGKGSIVPEGLWKTCIKCDSVLYRPELERALDVCPKCDHHMRIGARRRLDIFLDEGGRTELATEVQPFASVRLRPLAYAHHPWPNSR